MVVLDAIFFEQKYSILLRIQHPTLQVNVGSLASISQARRGFKKSVRGQLQGCSLRMASPEELSIVQTARYATVLQLIDAGWQQTVGCVGGWGFSHDINSVNNGQLAVEGSFGAR